MPKEFDDFRDSAPHSMRGLAKDAVASMVVGYVLATRGTTFYA